MNEGCGMMGILCKFVDGFKIGPFMWLVAHPEPTAINWQQHRDP